MLPCVLRAGAFRVTQEIEDLPLEGLGFQSLDQLGFVRPLGIEKLVRARLDEIAMAFEAFDLKLSVDPFVQRNAETELAVASEHMVPDVVVSGPAARHRGTYHRPIDPARALQAGPHLTPERDGILPSPGKRRHQ
jgi:hypothetical protein